MVKSRIECCAYFTVIDMFTVVFVFPPYQYSWVSCIWFHAYVSNSVVAVTGVKHKKPYTTTNLANPKINKLNHGMCWPNVRPTSFSAPFRGRKKALVRLAFKTTNCGF